MRNLIRKVGGQSKCSLSPQGAVCVRNLLENFWVLKRVSVPGFTCSDVGMFEVALFELQASPAPPGVKEKDTQANSLAGSEFLLILKQRLDLHG